MARPLSIIDLSDKRRATDEELARYRLTAHGRTIVYEPGGDSILLDREDQDDSLSALEKAVALEVPFAWNPLTNLPESHDCGCTVDHTAVQTSIKRPRRSWHVCLFRITCELGSDPNAGRSRGRPFGTVGELDFHEFGR